jgi:uncharacterized protein YlxP (DUF503 family)
MVVGVLRLDVVLHAPHSLKEKRGIVKSLVGRCRERFPVSAAETGLHDLWQRTELGFSMVAGDEGTIQGVFTRLEEEIARSGSAEIAERATEFLHY